MTPTEYQRARQLRGTQSSVAALLGIDPQTISRRERGEIPVTREAAMALASLRKPRKKNPPYALLISKATHTSNSATGTKGHCGRIIATTVSTAAVMIRIVNRFRFTACSPAFRP